MKTQKIVFKTSRSPSKSLCSFILWSCFFLTAPQFVLTSSQATNLSEPGSVIQGHDDDNLRVQAVKKRKRSQGKPEIKAVLDETAVPLRRKQPKKKAIPPAVSPQIALQQRIAKNPLPTTYFEEFQQILSCTPAVEPPLVKLDVEAEMNGGSRRWVKKFRILEPEARCDVETWHKNMTQALKEIQATHAGFYSHLSRSANFLLARLRVVTAGGATEEIPLKFFFVSGWPSNKAKKAGKLDELTKKIQKMLEKKCPDEDFSGFKLRTLTMNGDKQVASRGWNSLKEELRTIFDEDVDHDKAILGENRREAHRRLIEHSKQFPSYYFHSEQALRRVIHKKIARYKRGRINLDHVRCFVLDVCSYYDMCWFCSDSLTRCGTVGHQHHEDKELVVRCSSSNRYSDQPFIKISGAALQRPYKLGSHRTEFPGYEQGEAWSLTGDDNGTGTKGYRPYTAQSTIDDFERES